MIQTAIEGLGFRGREQGPIAGDTFFVGAHYLAWLDNTGFYGKMNGLWLLDGCNSAATDFVLKEPNGRAVNHLVVGERGDGQFAYGYSGADHAEVTTFTRDRAAGPEYQSCIPCEAYNHSEAFVYPGPVPETAGWWTQCNLDRQRAATYRTHFAALETNHLTDRLEMMHEGRLVVGANAGGFRKDANCGKDLLFPDQTRRAVYLQSGYRFYADKPYLERVYRIRNPSGISDFALNTMGVVGGFVLTRYPDVHPLKVFRYVMVRNKEAPKVPPYFAVAKVGVADGAWAHYAYQPAITDQDDYIAGVNGELYLSTVGSISYGRTLKLSEESEVRYGNEGLNYGNVLQGVEMAGGPLGLETLYRDMQGKTLSSLAVRRLEFVGAPSSPPACGGAASYSWETGAWSACSAACGVGTQGRTVSCRRSDGTLAAESFCAGARPSASQSCNLRPCCNRTYPVAGSCYCSPAAVQATELTWGDLIYKADSNTCRAALHSGAVTAAGGNVTVVSAAGCASYGASTRNGVTSRSYGAYTRSYYLSGFGNGQCSQAAGCPVGYFSHNGQCVNTITYPQSQLSHLVGRASGAAWEADVTMAANYMTYGPYATNLGSGIISVSFKAQVDNVEARFENSIITLEVYDATARALLATRTVRRTEFAAPFSYKAFVLSNVNLSGRAGHAMEFRVYWHDTSYVKLDSITVD